MPKVSVTLDITGFYFSETVDVSDTSTVKEVMHAVAQKTKSSDAKFSFSSHIKASGEFCRMIRIDFESVPQSRQKKQDGSIFGPPNLTAGTYHFDDMSPENVMSNPQQAWQYYIIREGEGNLSGGARVIVPFASSNVGNGSVDKLEDGDRIVWRLVGICTGPTGMTGGPSGGLLVKYV